MVEIKQQDVTMTQGEEKYYVDEEILQGLEIKMEH